MPKCPFCDHSNRAGVTQCTKCGAQLERPAEQAADAPPPPPAPEPGSLEADVLGLMQGGKKIEAIKLYRERTGADLMGAKEAVEELAAKHGISAGGSGCAGVVLFALMAGAVISSMALAVAVLLKWAVTQT